jgi:hypothetical protein
MSTYRNSITLKGFLGRDAELHVNTNQTPFAVLSLATNASSPTAGSWNQPSRFSRALTSRSRADCKATATMTMLAFNVVFGRCAPALLPTSSGSRARKRRVWIRPRPRKTLRDRNGCP